MTPKQVESLHLIGVKAFLLLGPVMIEEGWKQGFMSVDPGVPCRTAVNPLVRSMGNETTH